MSRAWTSRNNHTHREDRESMGSLWAEVTGMIPYVLPLFEAIGLFGLEPRLRQLVALAVARSSRCSAVISRHKLIGKAAGLTQAELEGSLDLLTAAELSAVALALSTVNRPLEKTTADPQDAATQHYTAEEIQQLHAVALAVDFDCMLNKRATTLVKRLYRRYPFKGVS